MLDEMKINEKKTTEGGALPKLGPACRSAAAQGAVLLKNENEMLPINREDHLAVFGRCQIDYYRSGTGSGGAVHVPYTTSLLSGLRSVSWLRLYEPLAKIYESWVEEHPFDKGNGEWASEPWFQEEMPLGEELVRECAETCNKALIVIGRTAGEDKDNAPRPGSYLLTEKEESMVKLVTRYFTNVAVVFNVSNIMDMLPFEKQPHIKALLYTWHGGMEGGNAAADLLTGEVTPSGRLTDTIACSLEDYPANAGYGHSRTDIYDEDIYVGYRYFETFKKERVLYPFGYGLSYTSFSKEIQHVSITGEGADMQIDICVSVRNTGKYCGREVVQLYVGAPMGKLGKPACVLAAFCKTRLLAPGEEQELVLHTDVAELASYDDGGITGHRSCFVLEAGDYHFWLGEDCRRLTEILPEGRPLLTLPGLLVTKQLSEAAAPVKPFRRLTARTGADGRVLPSYEETPLRSVSLRQRILENLPKPLAHRAGKPVSFAEVRSGQAALTELVAQLSAPELAAIVRGEGMCSQKVTSGTAAAFGGVTEELLARGIPIACASDGPSGIRRDTGEEATQLPIGTLLACSFDTELVEELFVLEGEEMYANGIDTLLGPGMNIHRHPLNGRNFEYFSEDPLVTGSMGAACVRGLRRAGVTGTIKHFACNNQEKARNQVDAVVSERALREIYLRGFELAVKKGEAQSVMTTYGQLNGCHTSCCYDLNTTILRGEWGFQGIVMTDWWAKLDNVYEGGNPGYTDTASMVRAQNDLYMVVDNNGAVLNTRNDNSLRELEQGELTIGELQRCACNILRFLLTVPACGRVCQPKPVLEIAPLAGEGQPLENNAASGGMQEECRASGQESICVDLSRLADGESLRVWIPGAGTYGVNVQLMSRLTPLSQLLSRLSVNGSQEVLIQTNGTDGRWGRQQVAVLKLSEGFYELSLTHIRPGIEFGQLEFRQVK